MIMNDIFTHLVDCDDVMEEKVADSESKTKLEMTSHIVGDWGCVTNDEENGEVDRECNQ